MPEGVGCSSYEPEAAADEEGRFARADQSFGGAGRIFATTGTAASQPGRQRDLLPLPPVRTVSEEVAHHGGSRVAARRRLKRAHIEEWAEDCVQALNEMSGHGAAKSEPNHGPTVMQRCALRHVLRSCAAMGKPPAGLTCEGALDGLLANKCFSGQPVALAPLDIELLSLPAAGSQPIDLATLVGDGGALLVEGL